MPRLKPPGNVDNKALMSIAKRAVEKAREVIPYSDNLDDENFRKTFLVALGRSYYKNLVTKALRENPFLPHGEDITDKFLNFENRQICLRSLLYLLNFHDKSGKNTHKDNTLFTSKERCENLARSAAKTGVGNCTETSFFVFNLLLEENFVEQQHSKCRIEIIMLPGEADHVFVVLNRAKGSRIYDMSTWGGAIIIDPWVHASFSVEEQFMLYKTDKNKAIPIFCHIYDNIKHAKLYIKGSSGSGHSKRFRDKGRMNFFQMPAYDKKEEPYQFVDADDNIRPATQSY